MRASGLVLALCLPCAAMAQQDAPLSAIDWLEQALTQPVGPSAPDPALPQTTPAPTPPSDPILARPLEQATLDSTGLFAAARIGLPRDLWGQTPVAVLAEGIAALDPNMVPAAQRLMVRLLSAEFAPPLLAEGEAPGALLTARLDKLIEIGALEQASQLIEGAPTQTAALNTRAFDIALLLGEEDRACTRLQGQLAGSSGEAARIFCLARQGEWQTAYTALGAARALGALDATEAGLLTRFLEEEDAGLTLPPPQRLTPMGWRVLEALGDPVGTGSLPVAFAHADLRGTSGWRAQIDAAERLTRTGVMQPERLMGIYSQRRAAASGGVWDRVRAVQALDTALLDGDTAQIGEALRTAWTLFEAVELENAFARIFAERLADHTLTGSAARVQWAILLLAETRLDRASAITPDTPLAALASALASGADLPSASVSGFGPAIQAAFATPELPMPESLWLSEGERGRLLLDTLALIADASQGDMLATEQSLAALVALGLERDARQIALELLLLDRRG
ncbi:hypothetical protein [Roseibaca sp. Y0-43]|uniref:hypothetical protein n=1 Tax=Roseibaca sp. Y0-43 TaxID=2816854 RepID=UPI001D0C3AB3|nr:hypothetical protein [Roseibaca sp. Y0-43]MCC1480143.1 hypothetical protein [Roseibaca sp. Y0-43]